MRPKSCPILVTERSARSWYCTGVQAVSPQVIISHPPGGRLPLLSAMPAVTFSEAEHHRPLAGTKLYCLVTEVHRCEQLAQGCYAAFAPSRIWSHDLLIASPTLYIPVAPPHNFRCGLLLQISYVAWSACIGHTDQVCKNGWTDRDLVWGWGLTHVGPTNHVLDNWLEVQIPSQEEAYLCMSALC